jgi:hypothetical protein
MFSVLKWSIKAIFILTGISSLFRCSTGYREKGGKITFNGEEISSESFVILNEDFAKDSATAWYKRKAIDGADVVTFQAVDDHYAKDKNRAYYCDEYRDGQHYYLTKRQTIATIEGTHTASFITLKNGYARDDARAWFEGVPFHVHHVASLSSIDHHFVKDNLHAYADRMPIAGSDGKTFALIDGNFAKDAGHIYYYGYDDEGKFHIKPLPCDRQTFQVLTYPYSKDNAAVFYKDKPLPGVHAPTLQVLAHEYARDKDHVFFKSHIVAGADAATFTLFAENDERTELDSYAKDTHTVYLEGKKITGADPASLKLLSLGYSLDDKHVFYKTKLITGANPVGFRVYDHGHGDADAEDAIHHYLAGKRVTIQ